MKSISWILLITTMTVWAQREGDKKDIDGQIFQYQKDVWIHEALGDNFDPSEEYTAVYRDARWNKWYQEGSTTLKKILDLGPNVVFKFRDRAGANNVYWVLESQDKVEKLLAGGAAAIIPGVSLAGGGSGAGAGSGGGLGSTGLAVGIGAAVVAGAVIVENNDDDDDDGTITRKRQ